MIVTDIHTYPGYSLYMEQTLRMQISSFMHGHQLAVVATTGSGGQPDAALVEYIVDDNWNLYFFTHDDSQKIKNLRFNNKIALVIGTVLSPNTLQITGSVELIDSGTDHFEDILIRFGHLETFYISPLLKLRRLNLILVKITITRLKWLLFNSQTGKEEYKIFTA